MSETKANLIRNFSGSNFRAAMVLAHGGYESMNSFVLRPGLIIIFVSRTARYLPQTVIDSSFYSVFTRRERLKTILTETNSRPPQFLKDWRTRTYGPGDVCPDITLDMSDPAWGMGLHLLPLSDNQLRTTPGVFYGTRMKLSELVSTLTDRGILFVTSCRSTPQMPTNYMNLRANYRFPEWSMEHMLQVQNQISSRMLKRRRNNRTRNANQPVTKRRRVN